MILYSCILVSYIAGSSARLRARTQYQYGLTNVVFSEITSSPDLGNYANSLVGVRRTIFMAYVLNLSVFSYEYGYCSGWLFMESLPFDARPGLWMAESPQAWISVAHTKSGEQVGEQLSSYHEFAEAFHGQSPDFCGDLFLILAAFAHNGLGGN